MLESNRVGARSRRRRGVGVGVSSHEGFVLFLLCFFSVGAGEQICLGRMQEAGSEKQARAQGRSSIEVQRLRVLKIVLEKVVLDVPRKAES